MNKKQGVIGLVATVMIANAAPVNVNTAVNPVLIRWLIIPVGFCSRKLKSC